MTDNSSDTVIAPSPSLSNNANATFKSEKTKQIVKFSLDAMFLTTGPFYILVNTGVSTTASRHGRSSAAFNMRPNSSTVHRFGKCHRFSFLVNGVIILLSSCKARCLQTLNNIQFWSKKRPTRRQQNGRLAVENHPTRPTHKSRITFFTMWHFNTLRMRKYSLNLMNVKLFVNLTTKSI